MNRDARHFRASVDCRKQARHGCPEKYAWIPIPGYHRESMFRNTLVTGGAGFVGSTLALAPQVAPPRHAGGRVRQPAPAGIRTFAGTPAGWRSPLRARRYPDPRGRGLGWSFRSAARLLGRALVLAGIGESPPTSRRPTSSAPSTVWRPRGDTAPACSSITSRVYPIELLRRIPLAEGESRFEIDGARCQGPGSVPPGLRRFPPDWARSMYGTTKLASSSSPPSTPTATACPPSSIAVACSPGPGRWASRSGIVVHWVMSHFFGRPLRYIGYGGSGKQVRDILHVDDLLALVERQLKVLPSAHGEIYNVGGGRSCSVSCAS